VRVSLCLSFDVATSFWENEKSDAKSLSHVKIWWRPTALQIPNKRWLHAGPRCCVTSQALEVVSCHSLFCFVFSYFLLVLLAYPAFVFSRPTDIQSSTMWRSLKVLGSSRRFGIRVHSFSGGWWWWFLPSSETPTDCSCGH
jgi:hypothetical protein